MDVTVITGAGISASAGIPTYRDQGSAWRNENFERMSHASRYGNYLETLIPMWLRMGENMLKADPTPFHYAVAERGWRVITQNVDGLHRRAGSENVIEVHGSIMEWVPLGRGAPRVPLEDLLSVEDAVDLDELRIRPDVVLFGERPHRVRECLEWVRGSDVVIYAGTSGNVYPVAEWMGLARRSVLVDPVPWGDFSTVFPVATDEWVEMGCPVAADGLRGRR